MASILKAIDFQHDRIARFAVNIDLWFGTGCAAWPTFARFVPWLLIGLWPREVDLVGCLAGCTFIIAGATARATSTAAVTRYVDSDKTSLIHVTTCDTGIVEANSCG